MKEWWFPHENLLIVLITMEKQTTISFDNVFQSRSLIWTYGPIYVHNRAFERFCATLRKWILIYQYFEFLNLIVKMPVNHMNVIMNFNRNLLIFAIYEETDPNIHLTWNITRCACKCEFLVTSLRMARGSLVVKMLVSTGSHWLDCRSRQRDKPKTFNIMGFVLR